MSKRTWWASPKVMRGLEFSTGQLVDTPHGRAYFMYEDNESAAVLTLQMQAWIMVDIDTIQSVSSAERIGFHGVLKRLLDPVNKHLSIRQVFFGVIKAASRRNELGTFSPILTFVSTIAGLLVDPTELKDDRPRVERSLWNHLFTAKEQWANLDDPVRQRLETHLPWVKCIFTLKDQGSLCTEILAISGNCSPPDLLNSFREAVGPLDDASIDVNGLAIPVEAEPETGDVVVSPRGDQVFIAPVHEDMLKWLLVTPGSNQLEMWPFACVKRKQVHSKVETGQWIETMLGVAPKLPTQLIPMIAEVLRDNAEAYALLRLAEMRAAPHQALRVTKEFKATLKRLAPESRKALAAGYPEVRAIAANTTVRPQKDFQECLRQVKALLLRQTAPNGDTKSDDGSAVISALPLATSPVQPAVQREPTKSRPAPPNALPRASQRAKHAPAGKVHRLLEAEWCVVGSQVANLRDLTLKWIEEKIGVNLGEGWNSGGHEFEFKCKRIETERFPGVMAFRLEHPDADSGGKGLARRWRVEGTIVDPTQEASHGMVALRLSAIDGVTELDLPPFSVPNLAKQWFGTGALHLLGKPADECWLVDNDLDFFKLRNWLDGSDRDAGLIVTAGEPVELPFRLRGVALHVHISESQVNGYRKRYGALNDGTAHVYPLHCAEPTVMLMGDPTQVERCVRTAAARGQSHLPTFADVRSRVRKAQIDHARRQGQLEAEGRQSEQAEFEMDASLDSAGGDTSELLEMAMSDLDAANEQIQALKKELQAERQQVRALKLALGTAPEQEQPPAPEPLPDTFTRLEAWAKPLRPRLVLGAKAVRHARDCESFYDKPLVYACLNALATHYWEMRFGNREEGRVQWEAFLEANRLSMSPVGHALDNHRFADAYKVAIDKRNYTLDMHLQGSSSRDPNRCLRIYLHCDEDRERLLIGHLPSHLPNTLT